MYYTENPQLQMQSWDSQMVDNNQLTTISDLKPHTIYTIRVQAFTSVGPGPLSAPVLVKTQQGGQYMLQIAPIANLLTQIISKPTHLIIL